MQWLLLLIFTRVFIIPLDSQDDINKTRILIREVEKPIMLNQAKFATSCDVTIPQHQGSVSILSSADVTMCIHHCSMYPYRGCELPPSTGTNSHSDSATGPK